MSVILPHTHGSCDKNAEELLSGINKDQDFSHISDLCSMLADGTRLRIFWILCHSEQCVINLSALMGMSSPAVSHHLQKLKSASLLQTRRDGKEVYYTAADTEEVRLLHSLIESLTSLQCPENS